MKERIGALVGEQSQYIWCGTFHSIFARILRRHAEEIGYGKNFTILDSDDQLKLIKQVMTELQISEKTYKPRLFQYEITNSKNHMVGHREYSALAGNDSFRKISSEVYREYDRKLIESNAMDFDDILINFVRLMKEHEETAEYYRNKFRYIMSIRTPTSLSMRRSCCSAGSTAMYAWSEMTINLSTLSEARM